MTRARLPVSGWLVLAALGQACAVNGAATDGAASVQNQCATAADCPADAVCVGGACYAHNGDVESLVLEVIPDATAQYGAGVSFLVESSGVSNGGIDRDVKLPALTKLVGHVQATAPTSGCEYAAAADGSIAAHLELSRTDAILGIPRAVYTADAALSAPKAGAPEAWSLGPVSIVPGTYDVYVRPVGDAACPVAPLLLSGVEVDPGDVALPLALPPPVALSGKVIPPAGASLSGWTVELVEPVLGRVISTSAQLGPAGPSGYTNFSIGYRPVQGATAELQPNGGVALTPSATGGTAGSPLIRLAPPKGTASPAMLWDLSAADLGSQGTVSLDMSGVSFGTVHVTGRMQGGSGNHPAAPGSVTLSALSLSGVPAGITASYSVSVTTDPDGSFEASLLPGQYRCVGVPDPSLDWAITEATWQIGTSAQQAGRTMEVSQKATLAGKATVPALSAALAGATVSAVASIPVSPNGVLDSALGKTPALPRPASDITGADGAFALAVDPGLFDVSVHPAAGSNLPWFVQPRALVTAPSPGVPATSIDVSIPLPVLVGGRMSDPDGRPIGNALVRAYALLTAKGFAVSRKDGATGVVQIAETRTADDGGYHLLVPARVAH